MSSNKVMPFTPWRGPDVCVGVTDGVYGGGRDTDRDMRDAPQIVRDVVARYERLDDLAAPPHGQASPAVDPWDQLRAFLHTVVEHPRARVLLVRRLRTKPATSQHLLRQLQKCARGAVESEVRAYARSILADAGYAWAMNASTEVSS